MGFRGRLQDLEVDVGWMQQRHLSALIARHSTSLSEHCIRSAPFAKRPDCRASYRAWPHEWATSRSEDVPANAP